MHWELQSDSSTLIMRSDTNHDSSVFVRSRCILVFTTCSMFALNSGICKSAITACCNQIVQQLILDCTTPLSSCSLRKDSARLQTLTAFSCSSLADVSLTSHCISAQFACILRNSTSLPSKAAQYPPIRVLRTSELPLSVLTERRPAEARALAYPRPGRLILILQPAPALQRRCKCGSRGRGSLRCGVGSR